MTYAATETSVESGSPVELYEFLYQNNYMRFTSAADPITYLNNTFAPYPISRNGIKSETNNVEQTLEISAFQDFPPALLFRTQAPSAVLNITVRRKHIMDTDNQFAVTWMGRVLSVQWDDTSQCKLICESDLASMKRIALRRLYQLGCPWVLYGAGCNLNASQFAVTMTSGFTASGVTVNVPSLASYPDGQFAGGYIQYFSSLTNVIEVFGIRSSSAGNLVLALVPYGIETAPTLTAYFGCAHNDTDCRNKFNNYDNFGGQPYIPGVNPFSGATLF